MLPDAKVVANPLADMVATLESELAQMAEVVTFSVEPLESVATALNCRASPAAPDGFPGVIAIDSRIAFVTVRTEMSVKTPLSVRLAVIVVLPWARILNRPLVVFMLATVLSELLQAALAVTSLIEPSDLYAVAVN